MGRCRMNVKITNPEFNPSGNKQVDAIKQAFIDLQEVLEENCPSGRRKSVALTHAETAAMFAVKSVYEP